MQSIQADRNECPKIVIAESYYDQYPNYAQCHRVLNIQIQRSNVNYD